MGAFADRGEVVAAEIGEYAAEIGAVAHAPGAGEVAAPPRSGGEEFESKLTDWASGLTMAATGLCWRRFWKRPVNRSRRCGFDRLARKEIYEERGTPDFQALQLQYGRLGAAFGRFFNVAGHERGGERCEC